MAEIIGMTEALLTRGLAYEINGDVYFDVAKYPDYGRLSKRRLEDLQAGARVEVDERKRHPMDFALWKSSKTGEPAWESPWGPGRPGWHIECSAMSIRHLGETFDIHGGGMDLIFPHHENEIAQSCGATGKEFARYWMHNGFVQINKEKMSKSLGNFFTIREIFEQSEWREEVTSEILRYFLLSTHYHGPLDFSDQALKETKNALNGFYDLFGRLAEPGENEAIDQGATEAVERCRTAFQAAMDDDLNTPMAIASLQTLRSDVNKLFGVGLSSKGRHIVRRAFRSLGAVLGLFQMDRWEFHVRVEPKPAHFVLTTFPPTVTVEPQLTEAQIEIKLAERIEAKKRKDFAQADTIRTELKSLGIIIEDKPDGTSRWKR